MLKLRCNVPCWRFTQGCSLGSLAMDPWFLTKFSIQVLVGQCIHSCWLLCKSMGIAMVIHIFDFSKTFSQIHFKLGWNMPWVPGKFVQMVIQWVSYIKKRKEKLSFLGRAALHVCWLPCLHGIHCLCNLRTVWASTVILHMLVFFNEGQTHSKWVTLTPFPRS